jgi:hypothetical protein
MSRGKAGRNEIHARLEILSALPEDLGIIPFSPVIDFGELVEMCGASGVFDPNSIEVIDLANGERLEFARSEDLAYGDRGRVEWAIADPLHREYEICFETAGNRPGLQPQEFVPMVGVGDLLRYNAGEGRPLTLASSLRLVDLTGDGKRDLVGCWNYYHRPGSPISGLVCFPRVGGEDEFSFGDMARLRFIEDGELQHFPGTYVYADFVDLDGDGLVDIAFVEGHSGEVVFFLNSGERDGGGLPIFARSSSVEVPVEDIQRLEVVDLDGDGLLDLVVNGQFIRNGNPEGWPFVAEEPIDLGSGSQVSFVDLDGDGRLDMVCLPVEEEGNPSRFCGQVQWRRRMGERVAFEPARDLEGVEEREISLVAAVEDGGRRGLLVQYNTYQNIAFYELDGCENGVPKGVRRGRAESIGAVVALSDQSWPCLCDWNGDGVDDLLVGGGYGWPRLVRNRGSNQRPAWGETEQIDAEEGPIRLIRDEILHSRHWHNMGYPYPAFVDWDGDGLPDLMLPNETNRIIWYKNIGTPEEPRFGERRFLEVDGFPDSEELRAASGRDGENAELPNHPYPRDERSPFFWRTGAGFADWNGDGLMDFITHSFDRKATLFAQYVGGDGKRRLRMEGPVLLEDGREIDDSIVGREKHWTESFRPIDWDGNGLIDLIYSLAGTGEIFLLRNVGSKEKPLFAAPRQMKCYGEPIAFTIHGPNAWPGDFNGDGKSDLLGCVEWSVYPFFAHAALEMEAHPEYRICNPEIIE